MPKELFSKGLQEHVTFSAQNNSQEVCQQFFKPMPILNVNVKTSMTEKATSVIEVPTAEHFCGYAIKKAQDASFCLEHKNEEAPLAFIAFLAGYVVETILRNKNTTACTTIYNATALLARNCYLLTGKEPTVYSFRVMWGIAPVS